MFCKGASMGRGDPSRSLRDGRGGFDMTGGEFGMTERGFEMSEGGKQLLSIDKAREIHVARGRKRGGESARFAFGQFTAQCRFMVKIKCEWRRIRWGLVDYCVFLKGNY